MNKLIVVSVVLWLTATLQSCGRYPAKEGPSNPIEEPSTETQVQIVTFGAPWCENCHRDLPRLNELLNGMKIGARKKIYAKVLVTSADNAALPPTKEVADSYRKSLGLNFDSELDPWRWTTFRKYFKNNFKLPAAVILNKDGDLIKAYAPGTFVPEEAVGVLLENIH